MTAHPSQTVFEPIKALIGLLNKSEGIVGLAGSRLILRKSKLPSLLVDDPGVFLQYTLDDEPIVGHKRH